MPERPDGFYWVRMGSRWEVAELSDGEFWYQAGSDSTLRDSSFDEIGERVERGSVDVDEREACARIAEEVASGWSEISWLGDRIAEKIRERK
jgi:hypothetical protein